MPADPSQLIESFLEDVRVQLLQRLDDDGFRVPADKRRTTVDVVETYYNVLHRLPEPRPRRVHRSQKLIAGARERDPAIDAVVNAIAAASEAGESLRPYLHDKLTTRPAKADHLLNDWRIYHFHVGGAVPLPERHGHVAGRYELLFAFATDHNLYFIDVIHHDAFADIELMKILHRTWPEAIAKYVVAIPAGGDTAEADRTAGRGCLTMFTTIDGTVYRPPGGGTMTNGLSADVAHHADWIMNKAVRTARDIGERAEAIVAEIRAKTGHELSELRLRFDLREMQDGKLWVLEGQSAVRFPVPW